MGLTCISRDRGLAVPVILREASPRQPMAAVIACLVLLSPGSEVRAQNAEAFTMALDRYDRAVNQAEALAKKLEGITCITAIAFPELQKQADRIIAEMNSTYRDVGGSNLFLRDRTTPDPVYQKQLGFWDDDDDRADDLEEDIALQLYRLKTNPCPPEQTFFHAPLPKQTSYFDGGHLGIELAKNSGVERKIERNAFNDAVTNNFRDSGDPLGIGIVAGYNFRPSNGNFVVGPFASFFITAPGLYLYGLAGAAFVNHDLNVNFATAARSNVTTPGFTLGLGGEYHPSSWQITGHPVTLFAQYQHTWWNDANFNTPTSSPAFNYAFRREDDTLKLGVNFYFGADQSQPAASQKYPVKAPASK